MYAFISFQVESDIDNVHNFIVKIESGVRVQGLNSRPKFVYVIDLKATEYIVDNYLTQIINAAVLRV